MTVGNEVNREDKKSGGGVVERYKAVCRMCHGGCGTIVEIVDGTINRVIGDKDNPINKGSLCSKAGVASVEQLYHSGRLDYPLMRVGERGQGKWRRTSWDEALHFIAEKMLTIRTEYGAEAVAFGRGTGINNTHIVSRLANLFGTPNTTAIAYFCYGPRVAVSKVTASGDFSQHGWDTTPIPDFYGKPHCIVQWGSQKRISNDHGLIGLRPMSDSLRLKPVNIVVDPRKPKAAGNISVWLPLRPGTDAAMALGWMRVIIDEELYSEEFVKKYCYGFNKLKERLREYPLNKVADITWCNEADIARAARAYATTGPACIVWGNGIEHSGTNTFQATRALLVLMGITGNLDIPGGNVFYPSPMFEYPELWDKLSPEQAAKRIGGDRFKGLNLTPYAYAHPPSLFQAILTEKPYPVKAYIVTGNNTVTCFPNPARTIAALKKLDLLVVMDMFMTPTAEFADVVLPAAGNLEREEPRLHLHTKGPQATFVDTTSRKLASIGERRSDWEFIIELGQKLGYEEYFPPLDKFANKTLAPLGVTWDELKKTDHGIEIPVEYRKYEKMGFGTPTGKFEIYSTIMEEWGYDPLPCHIEPHESPISMPERYKDYPLILNTGAKQPMYWHSQGRQLKSLRRLNPEPLVEINTKTAEAHGVKKGDYVWIETVRGRLRMRAHVNNDIQEKVISIPHGWWLPEEPGPEHGVLEVCSNVLLDDSIESCDVVLGSSTLKGLLARIFKAKPPASTVTEEG